MNEQDQTVTSNNSNAHTEGSTHSESHTSDSPKVSSKPLFKVLGITKKLPSFERLAKYKALVVVFYVVLILTTLYHFYYGKRIIPGVRIGDINLSGLTYEQAREKLESFESSTNTDLVLKYQMKEYVIKATDIGLVFDWDATISRAYEVGRTGNIFIDSKDKLAGLVKGLSVSAFYDYNDESLSNTLALIKGEINIEAQNSGIGYSNAVLVVTPSNVGVKVVDDGLYADVLNSYNFLNFSPKVIPIKNVRPRVVEDDVSSVFEKAKKVVTNTITLVYKDKKWVLSSDQLINYLNIKKDDNGKVKLDINKPRLQAFVDSLAQEVNELPRGQVTTLNGDKVVDFKIIKPGKELDSDQFMKQFSDVFFDVKSNLELPMKAVSDDVATKEKYGIYTLLGTGKSKYVGSIPGRIHNLSLATERTNGVLVPPGGIFSLNNSIGEVSARTGYNAAYIIQNGRTVLGEGGGVCQVSTTMFRAALNSGLPIVMRYPHAYRVHYYEEDSAIGLDASVFQPSMDFQFKNDTPNYVLIQTENDKENLELTYKIFGTPDGRTVEITTPVITSQSPPPAPLYQDEPTLQKGVVRQVDFAAWGATAKFSRTVKKGNEVLYNDTFVSRYQPWRAVFLVGTKE